MSSVVCWSRKPSRRLGKAETSGICNLVGDCGRKFEGILVPDRGRDSVTHISSPSATGEDLCCRNVKGRKVTGDLLNVL